MNFNNVFVIHLTRFNTLEEFEKVLKFNGIEGVNANKLVDHKNNGYLKIFFDRKTSNPIAFTHNSDKKKIHFQENYLDFLKNMPSLTYESDYKKNLDVDFTRNVIVFHSARFVITLSFVSTASNVNEFPLGLDFIFSISESLRG